MIGWKGRDKTLLVDPDEIDCLKRVGRLNDEANSIYELYKNPNPACEAGSVWKDIVLSPSRLNIQQELKYAIQKVERSKWLKFGFRLHWPKPQGRRWKMHHVKRKFSRFRECLIDVVPKMRTVHVKILKFSTQHCWILRVEVKAYTRIFELIAYEEQTNICTFKAV